MSEVFKIQGGQKLSGRVQISGSKNAALPILAATVASGGEFEIANVPRISDTESLLHILQKCGAQVEFPKKNVVRLDTRKFDPALLADCREEIEQMRAAILLVGPLLARFGSAKIPFPGGCVLGKRSCSTHLQAFAAMGANVLESERFLHLEFSRKNLPAKPKVILSEMSVTATENLLIFASCFENETEIRLAAAEPHVKNLCEFLQNCGASIAGAGTHNLKISGGSFSSGKVRVVPDMLEAGTFVLAGVLTGSNIVVEDFAAGDLDSFWQKLAKTGAKFTVRESSCETFPASNLQPVDLKTAVFPGFPTDLMAPFAVLLTQAVGESTVFETLFDGRFAFLFELEKMGAKIEMLNPHQARIFGQSKLNGTQVASQDLRAGAAVVLAALIAKGESEISRVRYIFRGYQDFAAKLKSLGASIVVA